MVDVVVLFSVANGGLLELGPFDHKHNVVITSLKDLNQHNHLLVLHEIVRASTKVEGVRAYHVLNLGT